MIAESYRERGYDQERILTVPYCTNPDVFSFHDRSKSRRVEVVASCVGVIGLRKGLGRLIAIARWAEMRNLPMKIHLIGPLEPEAPALLASAPRSIEWKGIKKGGDLVAQLHASDLYILPSYEEGFGISILEAMSTGLPVVVSEETGGKEALKNGANGVTLHGYTSDLLDAKLAPLLNDVTMRDCMGRSGRTTVEACYTAENYRKNLISEYGRMFEILQRESPLLPAYQPEAIEQTSQGF